MNEGYDKARTMLLADMMEAVWEIGPEAVRRNPDLEMRISGSAFPYLEPTGAQGGVRPHRSLRAEGLFRGPVSAEDGSLVGMMYGSTGNRVNEVKSSTSHRLSRRVDATNSLADNRGLREVAGALNLPEGATIFTS
jgi:hypothetical protein